jgi:N utilization substance protein B
MSQSPRRRAREIVLQGLYAYEHSHVDREKTFEEMLEAEKLSKKNARFAQDLYRLVLDNSEWADKEIVRLSLNWELKRIAAIDRTILRMALVELEKMPDTPIKVAINEAIELAKTFSTMESSSFINGIIDNFAKSMEHH